VPQDQLSNGSEFQLCKAVTEIAHRANSACVLAAAADEAYSC